MWTTMDGMWRGITETKEDEEDKLTEVEEKINKLKDGKECHLIQKNYE